MSIEKAFEQIGALAQVTVNDRRSWGASRNSGGVTIDIGKDKKGREYFDIRKTRESEAEITVVDRKPKDRHLLLMIKTEERPGVPLKTKYLCGHDEFHWFVAAVDSTAADVERAKESLKPGEVKAVQERGKGKRKKAKGGVKRQGEWFFIPKRKMKVPHNQILKDEPIQRGRGKPHMVEEIWRTGGQDIVVPRLNEWSRVRESELPAKWMEGLSPGQYETLVRQRTENGKLARSIPWRQGRVNAKVYGRGKVTHPDHSILRLDCWHEIVPNTESKFVINEQLRFID